MWCIFISWRRLVRKLPGLPAFVLLSWTGVSFAQVQSWGDSFLQFGQFSDAKKVSTHWREGIVKEEFVFQQAPFESCHASTIVETATGLAAAWFGGSEEGNADVGIWFSRKEGNTWTPVKEVATGEMPDGNRYPCWNPVLFQPRGGPLLLFYKVGPNPREWWGMVKTSRDGGKSWSHARPLPPGFLGPIKNKPIQFPDGSVLMPSSTESYSSGWRIHLERMTGLTSPWQKIGPLNDGQKIAAIQPTILIYPAGRVQILCRSKQKKILQCWSSDNGHTWSAMQVTPLPNPNSGIDAVTLKNGLQLLVYNHSTWKRTPLNVAISSDGKTWQAVLVLEDQPGEYSYPAVIQTGDNRVHVTYTWKRKRIKHVVLDPKKFNPIRMRDGKWPDR